ncbi:hypothetical protein [Streptomyces sp. NPDC051546]|uniref:hypothetical protein n=1 Tax=Streptomyces sp. NPDC051546 TaxID=3365655 RepID=UPI0037A18553
MINNLLRRGLPALALAALPLLTTTALPAAAHTPNAAAAYPTGHALTRSTATAAPGAAGVRAPLPLVEAIDRLPVAAEHREGYERGLYKQLEQGPERRGRLRHPPGGIPGEVVTVPQVEAGCKLTGGSWRSAYDHGRL